MAGRSSRSGPDDGGSGAPHAGAPHPVCCSGGRSDWALGTEYIGCCPSAGGGAQAGAAAGSSCGGGAQPGAAAGAADSGAGGVAQLGANGADTDSPAGGG